MTDPSPDCGYTDAEEVETVRPSDVTLNKIQLALDYCVHNHPGLPSALPGVLCIRCQAEDSLARLAAALAEQTRRTDQAFEEIARLREFGEHYSGAAQDAWDRIEVLEKALREEWFAAKLPDLDYEMVIIGSREVGGPVYDWAWAQHPWFALLGLSRDECVAALAAGSASPEPGSAPCPSCGPDGTHNISFDRSLCACGAMHYYCVECGRQTDPCAAAVVSTEPTE